MQIGMLGLGRMGADMTRRLLRARHECVVYDVRADAIASLARDGAVGASTLSELVGRLRAPRVLWLMLPAAIVPGLLEQLADLLKSGDIVVDGGNSDFRDSRRMSQRLEKRGIEFLDVGTSGGVWGLQTGYCLMIGGNAPAVQQLTPIFAALTATEDVSSEENPRNRGYLHCGPSGAGHFVKMVHNGVEYALMAAYAEGFNLLAHANRGGVERTRDAETAPSAELENYRFDLNLPAIADLWRQGSVVRSWLLDLAAEALHEDPQLTRFAGRVSDSGEGRWTLRSAIDLGVPMPGLANALFERFASQGENTYANKLLSALREQFGGHHEKQD